MREKDLKVKAIVSATLNIDKNIAGIIQSHLDSNVIKNLSQVNQAANSIKNGPK